MKKLFFALITSFLFVASSWGACSETKDGFSVGDARWGGLSFGDKYKEFSTNLNAPIISFDYKAVSKPANMATPSWKIIEYDIDGKQLQEEAWDGVKSGTKQKQLDKKTRKFRLVYAGNYSAEFSNITVTQGSYLEIPTDSKDFGVVSLNSDNNKTIKVEYSSITSNLTVKLAQQDNVFSTSLTGTSTNPVGLCSCPEDGGIFLC